MSLTEQLAVGKSLRGATPRKRHAEWTVAADGRDPVEIIQRSSDGRLPQLIPIRYGRMSRNPFAFFRGSAAPMAGDLANTPQTGIEVQACGDCHLANFGLFASPERHLVFDVNDFDETLRAPWEWDLKRLAASFAIVGRVNGFADGRGKEIAVTCARSYRENMREYASLSPLEIWHTRVDVDDLVECSENSKSRVLREQIDVKARGRVGEHVFPKLTQRIDGEFQFVEEPPLTTRVDDETLEPIRSGLAEYRNSLDDDRRFLYDRYEFYDLALRVVGVGSVGTRCFVGLFFSDERYPLFLQIKEARQSALEPFAAKSPYENQGRRVVEGQRLLQADSDLFLGWCRLPSGRDFYVRQLRDMKHSVPVESLSATALERYAEVCGETLARAHAKAGKAAMLAGYLGQGDQFDIALGKFALRYADQTEQDYAAFTQAVHDGRIEVDLETD